MVRETLVTLLLSVILLGAVMLSVITVGVNILGAEMVIVAMQSVIKLTVVVPLQGRRVKISTVPSHFCQYWLNVLMTVLGT